MEELTMADSHKSKNWRAEKSASDPENFLMLICVGITQIGLAYAGVFPEGTFLYILCDPTKFASVDSAILSGSSGGMGGVDPNTTGVLP